MVSAYFILVHRKILQVTLKCTFFLSGCFKTKEGLKNIMIDYCTIVAGDLSYVGGMLYSDSALDVTYARYTTVRTLKVFQKNE